jgi:hypothetical protein
MILILELTFLPIWSKAINSESCTVWSSMGETAFDIMTMKRKLSIDLSADDAEETIMLVAHSYRLSHPELMNRSKRSSMHLPYKGVERTLF